MTDEVHRQLTKLLEEQLSPGEQLIHLAWGQEEGSPGCLYFLIIAFTLGIAWFFTGYRGYGVALTDQRLLLLPMRYRQSVLLAKVWRRGGQALDIPAAQLGSLYFQSQSQQVLGLIDTQAWTIGVSPEMTLKLQFVEDSPAMGNINAAKAIAERLRPAQALPPAG